MKRIIIGNTLDQISEVNLEVGLGLAKAFNEKALVLHADKLADFDTLDTVFTNLNLEVHEHYINSIIEANNAALKKQIEDINKTMDEVDFESRSGSPEDVIVDEAKNENTDLIVLGINNDKNIVEKFLGGVTESVLHRCEKSILVVKGVNVIEPKRIMVAYDFSHHCNEAIEWAKKFNKTFGCEVHLVNIVPCYYEGYHLAHTYSNGLNAAMEEIIDESVEKIQKQLEDLKTELSEITKLKTDVIIDKEGSISNQLCHYVAANDMDMIIMGSHKRGYIEEIFLGSVTNKVLKKSTASILVAK